MVLKLSVPVILIDELLKFVARTYLEGKLKRDLFTARFILSTTSIVYFNILNVPQLYYTTTLFSFLNTFT